jgi:uncharacterized hydrophobic protein (TIGR00271 family)
MTSEAPSPVRRMLSPLAMLRSSIKTAREGVTEADRAVILGELFPDGAASRSYRSRLFVLAGLSSVIAAFGLLLDSTAAVIGAMLLGPLMVPLLASSLAVLHGWPRRLAISFADVAGAVVISVVVAWGIGSIAAGPGSLNGLPAQVVALTHPSLLDLGIALAAGVAAGYATARRSGSGALPGVAVSVTLEPPLAAMGIFLSMGETGAARLAGLTFVTNLASIVFAASLTMAMLGLVHRRTRSEITSSRTGLAFTISLVLAITVPLTLYSIRVAHDTRLTEDVGRVVPQWDPSVSVVALEARVRDDVAHVDLSLTGPRQPEPAWRLAEMLAQRRGGAVEVEIDFVLSAEDRAVATG